MTYNVLASTAVRMDCEILASDFSSPWGVFHNPYQLLCSNQIYEWQVTVSTALVWSLQEGPVVTV